MPGALIQPARQNSFETSCSPSNAWLKTKARYGADSLASDGKACRRAAVRPAIVLPLSWGRIGLPRSQLEKAHPCGRTNSRQAGPSASRHRGAGNRCRLVGVTVGRSRDHRVGKIEASCHQIEVETCHVVESWPDPSRWLSEYMRLCRASPRDARRATAGSAIQRCDQGCGPCLQRRSLKGRR
jgi:hypothetical protein